MKNLLSLFLFSILIHSVNAQDVGTSLVLNGKNVSIENGISISALKDTLNAEVLKYSISNTDSNVSLTEILLVREKRLVKKMNIKVNADSIGLNFLLISANKGDRLVIMGKSKNDNKQVTTVIPIVE